MILRRLRGRLNEDMRRILETDDILSTISFRLDTAVRAGRLRATTPGELLSFVAGLSERTIFEKSRSLRRMRRLERHASSSAAKAAGAPAHGDAVHLVELAIQALSTDVDRTIARLRLNGVSHRVIADNLGLSVESARQRWRSVRLRLIEILREGEFSG